MGSKATKTGSEPKRRRSGRKLLLVGLLGLGAAAIKALREDSAPAPAAQVPTPAPVPAPAPAAAPPAAHVHPTDVSTEPDPIEQLETESADVPGLFVDDVIDAAAPVEPPAPEPLAEPVFNDVPEAATTTEDLHDIVEEPWADAEVTPVTEPPVDSLTSFFDEVMTDTAERKLKNGN